MTQLDLSVNIIKLCRCLNYSNLYLNEHERFSLKNRYSKEYPNLNDIKECFYILDHPKFLNCFCYDVSYHNGDYKNEYEFSLEIPLYGLDIEILKQINNFRYNEFKKIIKERVIEKLVNEEIQNIYKIYNYL